MRDVTQTITGQFSNGCKHRARQKSPSSVCMNGIITTRGVGTAPFNQLPWLSLALHPGKESRQDLPGPGWCLRPLTRGQGVFVLPVQLSPL